MSDYHPDYWSVIRITEGAETLYRVFGSWSGSYQWGSSWRLNSGVTKVEETEEEFIFHGYSGSKYHCDKMRYGTNAYTHGVLHTMIEDRADHIDAEIMDPDTNWMELDYVDGG